MNVFTLQAALRCFNTGILYWLHKTGACDYKTRCSPSLGQDEEWEPRWAPHQSASVLQPSFFHYCPTPACALHRYLEKLFFFYYFYLLKVTYFLYCTFQSEKKFLCVDLTRVQQQLGHQVGLRSGFPIQHYQSFLFGQEQCVILQRRRNVSSVEK